MSNILNNQGTSLIWYIRPVRFFAASEDKLNILQGATNTGANSAIRNAPDRDILGDLITAAGGPVTNIYQNNHTQNGINYKDIVGDAVQDDITTSDYLLDLTNMISFVPDRFDASLGQNETINVRTSNSATDIPIDQINTQVRELDLPTDISYGSNEGPSIARLFRVLQLEDIHVDLVCYAFDLNRRFIKGVVMCSCIIGTRTGEGNYSVSDRGQTFDMFNVSTTEVVPFDLPSNAVNDPAIVALRAKLYSASFNRVAR